MYTAIKLTTVETSSHSNMESEWTTAVERLPASY